MKTFSLIRFLAMLTHINPAIWDAIIPHGPAHAGISAVATELNPQPLPPVAKLQLASAEVAKEIAHTAIAAAAAGASEAPAIVTRAIDDWCGNSPKHLPIPWPRPWPFPWMPEHGEAELNAGPSQIVGALTLASVAARMEEGELRDALGDGAERLLETGLAA